MEGDRAGSAPAATATSVVAGCTGSNRGTSIGTSNGGTSAGSGMGTESGTGSAVAQVSAPTLRAAAAVAAWWKRPFWFRQQARGRKPRRRQ